MVETLRRWAENLCRARSTSREDLSAAIEGMDHTFPDDVTWVEVDDREVGLGGIWLRFAPGAVKRGEFERVFGRGEALARVLLDAPAKFMTTVEVPGAPMRCTVIAEYPGDLEDADLQGLYLRTDRAH